MPATPEEKAAYAALSQEEKDAVSSLMEEGMNPSEALRRTTATAKAMRGSAGQVDAGPSGKDTAFGAATLAANRLGMGMAEEVRGGMEAMPGETIGGIHPLAFTPMGIPLMTSSIAVDKLRGTGHYDRGAGIQKDAQREALRVAPVAGPLAEGVADIASMASGGLASARTALAQAAPRVLRVVPRGALGGAITGGIGGFGAGEGFADTVEKTLKGAAIGAGVGSAVSALPLVLSRGASRAPAPKPPPSAPGGGMVEGLRAKAAQVSEGIEAAPGFVRAAVPSPVREGLKLVGKKPAAPPDPYQAAVQQAFETQQAQASALPLVPKTQPPAPAPAPSASPVPEVTAQRPVVGGPVAAEDIGQGLRNAGTQTRALALLKQKAAEDVTPTNLRQPEFRPPTPADRAELDAIIAQQRAESEGARGMGVPPAPGLAPSAAPEAGTNPGRGLKVRPAPKGPQEVTPDQVVSESPAQVEQSMSAAPRMPTVDEAAKMLEALPVAQRANVLKQIAATMGEDFAAQVNPGLAKTLGIGSKSAQGRIQGQGRAGPGQRRGGPKMERMAAGEFPVDENVEMALAQERALRLKPIEGRKQFEAAQAKEAARVEAEAEAAKVPEHMRPALGQQTKREIPASLMALKDPQLRKEIVQHVLDGRRTLDDADMARWVRMSKGGGDIGPDRRASYQAIQKAIDEVDDAIKAHGPLPGAMRAKSLEHAEGARKAAQSFSKMPPAFVGSVQPAKDTARKMAFRAADAGDIPLPAVLLGLGFTEQQIEEMLKDDASKKE